MSTAIEPAKIKGYMERVRSLHGDIATAKASNAKKQQDIKGDLDELRKEGAREHGVSVKALKALESKLMKRAKLEDELAKLDDEIVDEVDRVESALDQSGFEWTPLGAAAANVVDMATVRARKGPEVEEDDGQTNLEDAIKSKTDGEQAEADEDPAISAAMKPKSRRAAGKGKAAD